MRPHCTHPRSAGSERQETIPRRPLSLCLYHRGVWEDSVYNTQSQQRSCTVPPALAQLPTPSNPEACEPCASHQTPGLTQWTASHAQATVCVCCLVLTQYPYLPPRHNLWCGDAAGGVTRWDGVVGAAPKPRTVPPPWRPQGEPSVVRDSLNGEPHCTLTGERRS